MRNISTDAIKNELTTLSLSLEMTGHLSHEGRKCLPFILSAYF